MQPLMLYAALCLLLASHFHHGDALSVAALMNSLKTIAEEGLGTKKFQDHVEENGIFTEQEVDWNKLVEQLSQKLSSRLANRGGLLEEVSRKIRKYYHKFPRDTPEKECCKIQHISDDYKSRFKTTVDTTSLCYSKYAHSTSTVKHLGEIVTEQWQYNLEISPSVKWQYFGSVDGYFYQFPASKVGDESCGGYDPRIRPWYAAAMSFHKVVIIMFDISSNMGRCWVDGYTCLEMFVKMFKILISNFSSHDNFALVMFDNEVHYVEKLQDDTCYSEKFARMTSFNKKAILDYVKNIRYTGSSQAKYAVAIKGALKYLQLDKTKGPILMLITGTYRGDSRDGLADAIKTLKEETTDPILIAYYLGQASKDAKRALSSLVKDIGQGVVSYINSKTGINSHLGDFYKALAHNLGDDAKPSLSPPYYDYSIGLVSTVAKAVMVQGKLYGVAAVDIPLADLLTDVVEFAKSTSYLMLIDIYGGVLVHPLLPKPTDASRSNRVDVMINMLEPSEELEEKVFKNMRAGLNGSATVLVPDITARGVTHREGINVEYKNLTYYYHKVKNTLLSMCVVTQVHDRPTLHGIRKHIDGKLLSFTYHNIFHHDSDVHYCKYFAQKAILKPIVKFAPKAFIEPYAYQYSQETEKEVKVYRQIMRREKGNENFTDGVVTTVHLTHYLDHLWTSHITETYGAWRYIGTELGVMRLYPGLKVAKEYDPTARPWYKRAVNLDDLRTVTAPYLDAFGGGYVITVTQKIYERLATKKLYGVMAIDFTAHHFYSNILQEIPECQVKNYMCFIIDTAGFVVMHPDWFNGEWKLTKPSYYENIHVVEMELAIAGDMLEQGYMVQKDCASQHEALEFRYTEIVVDSANRSTVAPYYEYQKVPDTNIYLVKKDVSKSVKKDKYACNCADYMECPMETSACRCPCQKEIVLGDMCTGAYERQYNACSVDAAQVPVIKDNILGDLEDCFKVDCHAMETDKDCHHHVSCRWCISMVLGFEINPYCGYYDECYFGRVGSFSPYGKALYYDSGGSCLHASVVLLSVMGFIARYL